MDKKISFVLIILFLIIAIGSCKDDDDNGVKPDNPPITNGYQPTPYDLMIPQGFPNMKIPENNPLTVEGIKLGKMLFYDPILSGDSTIFCGSCHVQEKYAFTDMSKRFSTGVNGIQGSRTSMPIINTGWMEQLFWDGKSGSLEEQVRGPILSPVEMNLSSMDIAIERLKRHPDYPDLFYKAFVTKEIKEEHILKSIAQFMRIIISSDSKFDRFYFKGEETLTEAEMRGWILFNSEPRNMEGQVEGGGDCFHCHGTVLFTTNRFSNNGLDSTFTDLGLGGITGKKEDEGKFKIPTLRNIEYTAPYMHDGRFETLMEVIEHYNSGGVQSHSLDPQMKTTGKGGLMLTQQEKLDLLAFLKTLSDQKFITNDKFSNPF